VAVLKGIGTLLKTEYKFKNIRKMWLLDRQVDIICDLCGCNVYLTQYGWSPKPSSDEGKSPSLHKMLSKTRTTTQSQFHSCRPVENPWRFRHQMRWHRAYVAYMVHYLRFIGSPNEFPDFRLLFPDRMFTETRVPPTEPTPGLGDRLLENNYIRWNVPADE